MGYVTLLCCDQCGKVGDDRSVASAKGFFSVQPTTAVVTIHSQDPVLDTNEKPMLCEACARPLLDMLKRFVERAAEGVHAKRALDAAEATGQLSGPGEA